MVRPSPQEAEDQQGRWDRFSLLF